MSTRPGTGLLALAVLVLLEGCATSPPPRGSRLLLGGASPHSPATSWRYDAGLQRSTATPEPEEEEVEGSVGGVPVQTEDPFQVVQEASGLAQEARHPVGAALYLGQARELLEKLARTPVTARSFAPRRVLYWLLREALEGGERVGYAELKWRTERFWLLVLVRPDGYLVTALTGTPLQRLGPLELKGGEWRVAGLTVGDFYFSRMGVFYAVTEALRRAEGPPLGGAVVVEGTTATSVAVDLGALSILHMASGGQGNSGGASGPSGQPSKTTSAQGPGKWTYKTSTTGSKRAQEYQEQITGRPAWYVYRVGEVEFDGFNGLQLLEAKGRGYKNFISKDGRLQPWYEAGKGFQGLMEQARRQSKLAERLKLPVVWHVAEVEFANFLRKFFKANGWTNIEVRHTPPVQ